jgi:hypothetical protein
LEERARQHVEVNQRAAWGMATPAMRARLVKGVLLRLLEARS